MKKIVLLIFLVCLVGYGKEVVDLLNEGIILLKAGDYKKSIEIFEEARRKSPENPEIYYYIGEAYFRNGDTEKAISNLQKAIEMNPENPSYHYTLAMVYLSQNKNKEAIESLDKTIKLSPLSMYGKNAEKLKKEIESKDKEEEIVIKRWEKLEIEEKKRKEEMKKQQKQAGGVQGPTEGMPPGIPGVENPSEMQKEQKVPIKTLIKRIKFGTENVRISSSNLLLKYPGSEISQVIGEILELMKSETNPEIKRNLIIASGKVNNPEVIDTLLSIIKDDKELFELRIVALDTIENLKTEKVISELRDTLSQMVSSKEKDREEARKNIQQISQQVDDLIAKKITLSSALQDLNNKKSQIDSVLGASPELGGMPPEMMPPGGVPAGPIQPGGPALGGKILNEKEVKKLMEEKRKLEDKIKENSEELDKINKQLEELNIKKRKYEELLALKGRKIDITGLGSTAKVVENQPRMQEFGPPGVMGPEFMPQPEVAYSQRQTDEERNEIIFAVKLINILGNMRDKTSLPVIKKAWKEFGVPGLRIYYYIALGKLGEYRNIDEMIQRLKENFPQGDVNEEVSIRKNILEVLGDYLKENPDESIKGLIEFLAEESEYPEIKNTAQQVLSSIAKVTKE
jgi:tetratricopeptide (TPR) repeat protein